MCWRRASDLLRWYQTLVQCHWLTGARFESDCGFLVCHTMLPVG
jgi:hypothetical protein